MKAIEIAGLLMVGSILGFVFRSISHNGQQPIADIKLKPGKTTKTVKRTPTANKTRKKKVEGKPKIN